MVAMVGVRDPDRSLDIAVATLAAAPPLAPVDPNHRVGNVRPGGWSHGLPGTGGARARAGVAAHPLDLVR
jgi:hypothetical protein